MVEMIAVSIFKKIKVLAERIFVEEEKEKLHAVLSWTK